jgi:pimeloyl-ACP methyl ester carboxylesterase
MPSTIYCFSGLGADEKLFENLSLPGYTLQHIHWLPPLQQETLPQYAQRLAAQIKEPNPLLLGVSFGGMLAVEVAKMINAKQTILISSIQSATQLPAYYHWANGIKMTTWLPAQLFKTPGPAADFLFGTETAADKKLLRYFMRHADAAFIKWALKAIINWKNKSLPANLVHIHGSSDRIIPIPKNVQHVIKGGGHLMIYNRAAIINKLLEEILPT